MSRAAAVLVALSLSLSCGSEPEGPVVLDGATMGTLWRVTLADPGPGVDVEALAREIPRRLRSIDADMSTYDPDSEVSQFNAGRALDWFDVSEQTATVVSEAQRLGRLTHGAFDVTVGPLVELWGLGAGPAPGDLPDPHQVVATRERVGLGSIEVRLAPPALRKRRPDVCIDLSGVAKGYAVDAVAARLDASGVEHYLVEIGGELRARGRGPAGRPWRVGIEDPADPGGSIGYSLSLVDRSLATSGDYRRHREAAGRRLPHVIDPRTGHPVVHGVASATVLASTCLEADAFATALMALDPTHGLELAQRQGLQARLLRREGDDLVELRTPAFPPLVVE